MTFIALRVRHAFTMHGYAADGSEIIEKGEAAEFAPKIIALDRVLSISEQYLLVSGVQGRAMYWEYQGSLEDVQLRLRDAGLLLA